MLRHSSNDKNDNTSVFSAELVLKIRRLIMHHRLTQKLLLAEYLQHWQ
jgi:hypothetical protein